MVRVRDREREKEKGRERERERGMVRERGIDGERWWERGGRR